MDLSLISKVLRLKYEFGSLVGQYPVCYKIWCQLFSPDALIRFVSSDTDIVIEGFPRSGNTYAVAAFVIAQKRNIRFAHHTHKVMQIKRAVKLNKPTMVLIRQPADAVVSLSIRHPYITLEQALRTYIRYYKGIKPYRSGYTLAKFEDVTVDYGAVIEKVNEQFGTNFEKFQHNAENKSKAFQFIEAMHLNHTGNQVVNERTIARPSTKRSQLNARLRRHFDSGTLKEMLEKANEVYEQILCI